MTPLLLGTTLLAQEPEPAPKPATRPTPQPATQPATQPHQHGHQHGHEHGQQPDKPQAAEAGAVREAPPPRELTPQERLASLRATLAKVKTEKERLLNIEKNGGLVPRLLQRLDRRNVRGDAAVQLGPKLPKPRHARLLGDAEKASLAEDVIFTVDSLPVTQEDFDSLYAYLRSYPRRETTAEIKTEAIQTLIKARAAEAAGKDNVPKALAAIRKIRKQLEGGASFSALAKEHSQDQATAAKGGDLGYVTRDHPDKLCAQALFTMNLAEVSDVVRGIDGFHLLRVRGAKRGATADKDRVRASHILVRYTPDVESLEKVMGRVDRADVDVAFREKELREFAPEQFQRK